MISFRELIQAVQDAAFLIVLVIIAHAIVTSAGRVLAAIVYGIASQLDKK